MEPQILSQVPQKFHLKVTVQFRYVLRKCVMLGLPPLFWTSLWNYVSRGISIGTLSTHVLRWRGDRLQGKLLRTKKDTTSEKVYWKNVYCNLDRNEICPILWLAVEIFSKSIREAEDGDGNDILPLFTGEDPEAIFSKQ